MSDMQEPMRCHRRRRRRQGTDEVDNESIAAPDASSSRRIGLHHRNISKTDIVARPIMILACLSILNFTFGWSPPPSSTSRMLQRSRLIPPMSDSRPLQLVWNSHPPRARIKASLTETRTSQLWASSRQPSQPSASLETEQSNSLDPPIVNEINQLTKLLIQCLHNEQSSGNDDDILSSQPIDILKKIMYLYTKWTSTAKQSPQLKFKVSATVDKAFRHVTSEAFSAPYQLNWVNLGMEALQMQLHSGDFCYNDSSNSLNGNSTINGESSVQLIPLQRPYNAIPKGTWLKALRALTSNDLNSSTGSASSPRSVRTFSAQGDIQWIAPSDAAFRILQRLVNGRGLRIFQKKKQSHQQWQQQLQPKISLDERDFNMVLHAYATSHTHSTNPLNPNTHPFLHAAHRVMALQERTPHAPPLSPVAYSILLKAYGNYRDVKNVEMSLVHAQRNGVVPDVVMANTVVDAYVNCGLLERAQDVFRCMDSDNGGRGREESFVGEEYTGYWHLLRPNSRTFNTLLKGMAEEGDVRGAMKLSKVVQTKGLWDDITTNTLVKAAVTARDFDLAETILANHTSSTTRRVEEDHPNVEAHTELIDGYAKDNQLESALRVMQIMQQRGVTPNEYTYTCMVGALARKNKVRQARKLIHYATTTIVRRRMVVLTPTYNAFISGLLSDNKSQNVDISGQSSHAANMVEVLAVLQEMQEYNIHPNVVTVALVVDGLGRCHPPRCKEAKELVQHLQFNSRVKQNNNGYYNQGEGENEKAKGISLSNNKIATSLIRAYGRANDVQSAMEAFERISPTPDVVAFNALLDAYCRCDELALALILFQKHASYKQWNNLQGEAATTSTLRGNVAGDETTGQRMVPIIIKPDVVTYTSLITALLQLKSRAATKRANALYDEMKKKWWISPDTILVDTILTAMISGGPNGLEDDDVKFILTVLRDGARLEWQVGQYENRKRAVRGILMSCSSKIWKKDEFAFDLVGEKEPEDPLFAKKGWNKIDSGFQLWGGGNVQQTEEGDGDSSSSVDSFLASKGWNDIDSGFRLL